MKGERDYLQEAVDIIYKQGVLIKLPERKHLLALNDLLEENGVYLIKGGLPKYKRKET